MFVGFREYTCIKPPNRKADNDDNDVESINIKKKFILK